MNSSVFLRIRRTSGWQEFEVTVAEPASLLDALEAACRLDPSLGFRHSCHHASCGQCGVRVNGRERLACLTPAGDGSGRRRTIRVEPLRNLPVSHDLIVDLQPVRAAVEAVGLPLLRRVESQPGHIRQPRPSEDARFEDCIQCGLCVSACPIMGANASYLGPAALAAAGRVVEEPRGLEVARVLEQVDCRQGLWRCHAALECSRVCPTGVDAGRLILSMRARLMRGRAQKAAG